MTCQGLRPPLRFALLFSALVAVAASRAASAGVGGGGGAEWFAGPADQSTAIVYGYAGWSFDRASIALGALRFDDAQAGRGWGPLLAAAAPVHASVLVRAQAIRYVGEGELRATRLKIGPEWTMPHARTLGIFFTGLENNLGGSVRGASLEFRAPLRAHWIALASGGASRLADSEMSAQAAVGLAWSPSARLEIAAEAGIARNGAFIDVPTPGRGGRGAGGPLGLPIGLGSGEGSERGGTETRSVVSTDPTISLGLRFALP